jgi:hypothetical protein
MRQSVPFDTNDMLDHCTFRIQDVCPLIVPPALCTVTVFAVASILVTMTLRPAQVLAAGNVTTKLAAVASASTTCPAAAFAVVVTVTGAGQTNATVMMPAPAFGVTMIPVPAVKTSFAMVGRPSL